MARYNTKFDGIELEVEYIYSPMVYPDYEYPGEPANVDLLSIMVNDSEVDILDIISQSIIDTIKQEILEYHE
jgi:hypothetical protein